MDQCVINTCFCKIELQDPEQTTQIFQSIIKEAQGDLNRIRKKIAPVVKQIEFGFPFEKLSKSQAKTLDEALKFLFNVEVLVIEFEHNNPYVLEQWSKRSHLFKAGIKCLIMRSMKEMLEDYVRRQ